MVVASFDIPPKDFAGWSYVTHAKEWSRNKVSSSVQSFMNSQGYIYLGLVVMDGGDGYLFIFILLLFNII